MNKLAFQSTPIGDGKISLLSFKTGGKLFMAMQQSFAEQHPKLGIALAQDYYHAAPMTGAIASANLKEDASYEVTVILLDERGNPIPSGDSPISTKTFIASAKDKVSMNQWCDDEAAVTALCVKKNSQNNAGMEELMQTLQECINFNKQSNRLIEKATLQDESNLSMKTAVIIDSDEEKKTSPSGGDYFNKQREELKKEEVFDKKED